MCDINMIQYMTYDTISRCQSGSAYQWSAAGNQEVFFRRQCRGGSHPTISSLSTTGLSLCSGSPNHENSAAYSGAKNSFHRETSFPFGSSFPPIGPNNGRVFEHAGGARLRILSPEGRAWLRNSSQRKFNVFITSIGWQHRNFSKLMNSWFLRRKVLKRRMLTREV